MKRLRSGLEHETLRTLARVRHGAPSPVRVAKTPRSACIALIACCGCEVDCHRGSSRDRPRRIAIDGSRVTSGAKDLCHQEPVVDPTFIRIGSRAVGKVSSCAPQQPEANGVPLLVFYGCRFRSVGSPIGRSFDKGAQPDRSSHQSRIRLERRFQRRYCWASWHRSRFAHWDSTELSCVMKGLVVSPDRPGN